MTDSEKNELDLAHEHLSYWQRQLRLDHIDVEISFYAAEDNGPNLGTCLVAPSRHMQKIQLRHPDQKCERDKAFFRRDLEVVIVHELLHTKETPWRDHPSVDEVFEKDKWLRALHEDSMDAIAEALVRARRGLQR